MISEYYVKRKVVCDGKLLRTGDKIKIEDKIAEKFPAIFERIKNENKKMKRKIKNG